MSERDVLCARYACNFVFTDADEWDSVWASASASSDVAAAIDLVIAMSEVSEEYDCSTWHTGLENTLAHHAANGLCVEQRSGFCEVERCEMDNLLALSAKCGGWWEWRDGSDHPTFVPRWIPPGARP